MKHFAVLFACVALTACASTPAKTLQAPAILHCAPAIGPAPDYPDTDAALKAAPDLFTRVKLMVAGRLMRIAREKQLNAALAACAK